MRIVYVMGVQLILAGTAVAQENAPQGGPDITSMFLMMGVILAIMYVLMIRPEQKKQKKRQSMLSSLKKGNRVVTTGGIHGTVWNVKDNSVMVKVSDNVTLEFAKPSIASVGDEAEGKDGTKAEKKG